MTSMPSRTIPLLICQDIQASHDFLVNAFGFRAGGVSRDAAGLAVHGEVEAGDTTIWLHRVVPEKGLAALTDVASSGLVIFVDDVDAHYRHAKSAGARIDSEPTDQSYGQREYGARDLDGHRFWFATPLPSNGSPSKG
jgi:uncharacterized glyoxalase superfamily protein PhnB